MTKNVRGLELIVRVVLAIISALLALLMGAWPGWARIVLGVVAVVLLATAVVGY